MDEIIYKISDPEKLARLLEFCAANQIAAKQKQDTAGRPSLIKSLHAPAQALKDAGATAYSLAKSLNISVTSGYRLYRSLN